LTAEVTYTVLNIARELTWPRN